MKNLIIASLMCMTFALMPTNQSNAVSSRTISGKVVDCAFVSWELAGVSVVGVDAAGSEVWFVSTMTDMDGKYTLGNVPSIVKKLKFIYLGYQTLEVSVAFENTINVCLSPEPEED